MIALLKTKYPDTAVRLINNLAVNGMKADQLAKLLETDKGYRYALRQANLIVFTIGGNDLFQIAGGASPSRMTGVLKLDKLQAELPQGLMRLDAITKRLNAMNRTRMSSMSACTIRFTISGTTAKAPCKSRNGTSRRTRCFTGTPTCPWPRRSICSRIRSAATCLSDHFHPNHVGYAQIAGRIVQSLE